MIRTLRSVVGCVCLSFAMIAVYGSYGCGTTCSTDADCTGGKKCNTSTSQCETKSPKAGCQADADCGASGKVCDTNAGKNGKCFDSCSADADCSQGNTCDTTLKRCVCKADDCTKRNDGGATYSCHPVTNQCEPQCANDSACENGEKCQGPENKKHCLNPNEIVHKCNDTDKKCQANEKCDTAQIPNVCVATGPKPCAKDDDCVNNPAGDLCDTSTKKCVACLDDTDCLGNNEECTVDGTCKAKANCESNKACFDATAGSYCPDKTGACQTAELSCDATNKASGNDAWTANIKNGKGSIIWNAKSRLLTDAKSCLDLPSGDKCKDNSECSAGEVCSKLGGKCIPSCKDDSDCEAGKQACNADWGDLKGTKGCVIGIPNGTVEVTFNFYSPKGAFKTGAEKNKGDIIQLHKGGIATKVTINSGDKTEGVAQFSFCEKGASGKSFSFFVKDENGDPSNSACYSAK